MYFICCFKRVNKKVSAFSLLEAAIVLTIFGIISVAGLSALRWWKQYQQAFVTQQRQEQILWAISAYAVHMGHFPYPADPQASIGRFGLSKLPTGSPKDQVGIVPYRTLGISETVAKDGYGRYFTYVGGSPAPSSLSSAYAICISEPAYSIYVMERNQHGSLENVNPGLPGLAPMDPIILVLISHGANGYGAWIGTKGKLSQKVSGICGPDEQENARATQYFILAPRSYEKTTYYDDNIWWITRHHLLASYAKISCKPSEKPFV